MRDRLQSARREVTRATPRRKKRRYGAPGASTSHAGCGAAGEFDVVAEQLRKVMEFMHRRLGMDMDEIGLAQEQPPPPPPPPPPHDQAMPPQIDPGRSTPTRGQCWALNVDVPFLCILFVPQLPLPVTKQAVPTAGPKSQQYHSKTDIFRLYSVSNQKWNPFSVSDRISDDVFRDGKRSVSVPFLIPIRVGIFANQKRKISSNEKQILRNHEILDENERTLLRFPSGVFNPANNYTSQPTASRNDDGAEDIDDEFTSV
ncbi:hypothetical protein Scep_001587 [Stephania cephalantha]|uniref:Uncharacterized protein n=1 Tax=Stephania cephalantha TaxID=152367 RepID=A0AAP0L8P3_9MAGN